MRVLHAGRDRRQVSYLFLYSGRLSGEKQGFPYLVCRKKCLVRKILQARGIPPRVANSGGSLCLWRRNRRGSAYSVRNHRVLVPANPREEAKEKEPMHECDSLSPVRSGGKHDPVFMQEYFDRGTKFRSGPPQVLFVGRRALARLSRISQCRSSSHGKSR